MEDSFRCYLFSHDMMNSTLVDNIYLYQMEMDPSVREAMGDTPFNEVYGQAIAAMQENNREELFRKSYELMGSGYQPHDIGRWALASVSIYFREGYEPMTFLLYSAMLCGVAGIYCGRRVFDVSTTFRDIIASVMTAFVLTREFKDSGGWETLYKTAETFVQDMNGVPKVVMTAEATEE